MKFISDPLIELLAIKLYEHDTTGDRSGRMFPGSPRTCWLAMCEEGREIYRAMARGERPLSGDDE